MWKSPDETENVISHKKGGFPYIKKRWYKSAEKKRLVKFFCVLKGLQYSKLNEYRFLCKILTRSFSGIPR